MIRGEAHLLRELIGNLVDNAIRYGRPGGTITLTLQREPLAIYVDDDGPGLPLAERSLALERFYRGGSSDSQGGGLGLAIAREIALRHAADLGLHDSPGGQGLRVSIVF